MVQSCPLGGGGRETGRWFWHQNPCILAVPTAGLTFPGETSLSPFSSLQESVTANSLADASGGRGKVHTPSIMNEPFPVRVRWELGQISPGNGVKVKLIRLQDDWEVRIPMGCLSGEEQEGGGMIPWLRMCAAGVHAQAPSCVCMCSCMQAFLG